MKHLVIFILLLLPVIGRAQVIKILGLAIDANYYANVPDEAVRSTTIHTNLVYTAGKPTTLPTTLRVHSTTDATISVESIGTFFSQDSSSIKPQSFIVKSDLTANEDTDIKLGDFNYYDGVREKPFGIVVSVTYPKDQAVR